MENKKISKNRKYLSLNEISSLLQTIRRRPHGIRNYCLTLICFIHGLRASEVCRLRTSDIDLEARCIYIRRLKNGFSTIHPLLEEEIQALKAWFDVRINFRHATEEWLFLSCKGNHLSRQQFHQIIATSGEIAGISLDIHPHMLRHSCGFALADQGIDTRLIQDYLGHCNIRHTVWYTASNPSRFFGIWERRGNRSSDTDRNVISVIKPITYQSGKNLNFKK